METVTISIETYESMKADIKMLKKENETKTIIKEVLPDTLWFIQQIFYIVLAGVGMIILFKMH